MNAVRLGGGNPILWLVIGIPLLTLFGGYLTLRAAYQSGASDEMPDDVIRTGQAQVVELAPDRQAAAQRLRISIAIDAGASRIRATQDSGQSLPARAIELRFVHPLHANEDRVVQLLSADTGWYAALPKLADSDWRLVLRDADAHWRLVGHLPRRASQAVMRPALSP